MELLSIKGLLQKRIKDAKEVVIECHAGLSGLKRAYQGVKDASFDIQFTSLRDLMVHLDNCSKVTNTGNSRAEEMREPRLEREACARLRRKEIENCLLIQQALLT